VVTDTAREEIAQRDRNLNRVVGPLGLAANIVNIVIGAGIFVLPAAIAREAGTSAPLVYVACAIIMGAVALCFAEAGSRVPTSGGPYGYAEAAFGPFAGFVMGALIWLSAVLASAGIASAAADTLGALVPALRDSFTRNTLIIGAYLVLVIVNSRGAAPGARLVGFFTIAKLLPLLVFLLAGATIVQNITIAAPASAGGFGRGMLLAIFAFSGMETALGVSGEVRAPARSVPRALLGAMAAVTVIYIAVQLVAQGVLGDALSSSTAPLADTLAPLSPQLAQLLLAGAAISMSGYLAGNVFSAPRLIFAAARDGFLPSILATLGARRRAPVFAIVTHAVIAAYLALSGTFVELAILTTLAAVGIYILGCVSAVVLQRRGVATVGAPLGFKGTLIAAIIGSAGMLWVAAQATLSEVASIAVALAIIGALYLAVRFLRRPRS